MDCLEIAETVSAGSDITFSLTPDEGGLFPDISDIEAGLKVYFNRDLIIEMSIGSPTENGSSVTLEIDGSTQFLAFIIKAAETVNLDDGNLICYTTLVSSAYGTRTEAKWIYEICKVL